jgi:hypothetical protein
MRRVFSFLIFGLPIGVPLCLLALLGLGGRGGGAMFAWIGIVGGLPWNIPALALGVGTVLSGTSGAGILDAWSMYFAVAWACMSLLVNCALVAKLVLRTFGINSRNTQEG